MRCKEGDSTKLGSEGRGQSLNGWSIAKTLHRRDRRPPFALMTDKTILSNYYGTFKW